MAWLKAVAQNNPELKLAGDQRQLQMSQRVALMTPLVNASQLGGQEQIGLITNADDVILAPGDLSGLHEIFGDRARVHPYGGHMGNLAFWPVAEQVSGYFTA